MAREHKKDDFKRLVLSHQLGHWVRLVIIDSPGKPRARHFAYQPKRSHIILDLPAHHNCDDVGAFLKSFTLSHSEKGGTNARPFAANDSPHPFRQLTARVRGHEVAAITVKHV